LGNNGLILWITGLTLCLGVFWFVLCSLLSRFSGWALVASVYGVDLIPEDTEIQRFVNGKMGGFEYRGVLHLFLNDRGFGLRPVTLYRIGHQSVFIPWQRIRIIEVEEHTPERNITFEILGNEGESLSRLSLPEVLFQKFQSFLLYT
jgi:hypothetical protein